MTGAAGRGVSFLPRAPQRLGLSIAGLVALTPARFVALTPALSLFPSARPAAAQPLDPARLPLLRPSCPWPHPAAPGGSRCSCCYSVKGRARARGRGEEGTIRDLGAARWGQGEWGAAGMVCWGRGEGSEVGGGAAGWAWSPQRLAGSLVVPAPVEVRA